MCAWTFQPAWFGVVFAIGVAALVIAQYIRFRRRK